MSNNKPMESKQVVEKDLSDEFPNWYVSLSFGKSRSKNYPQAVALAKMAPKYIENKVEGNVMHQAIYSEQCNEYLAFIKLYELINNWKSSFVVINGQLVDRKIIGGINYCYGDKCRSGNSDFCYGASVYTNNPFGCHRIQISQYNNPWWSFGEFDRSGIWHVNKDEILKRIKENSKPYHLCPAFSIEQVMEGYQSLPDKIDPSKSKDWERQGENLTNTNNSLSYKIELNINTNDISGKNRNDIKNKPSGCGCLGISTLMLSIFFIILFLL